MPVERHAQADQRLDGRSTTAEPRALGVGQDERHRIDDAVDRQRGDAVARRPVRCLHAGRHTDVDASRDDERGRSSRRAERAQDLLTLAGCAERAFGGHDGLGGIEKHRRERQLLDHAAAAQHRLLVLERHGDRMRKLLDS